MKTDSSVYCQFSWEPAITSHIIYAQVGLHMVITTYEDAQIYTPDRLGLDFCGHTE